MWTLWNKIYLTKTVFESFMKKGLTEEISIDWCRFWASWLWTLMILQYSNIFLYCSSIKTIRETDNTDLSRLLWKITGLEETCYLGRPWGHRLLRKTTVADESPQGEKTLSRMMKELKMPWLLTSALWQSVCYVQTTGRILINWSFRNFHVCSVVPKAKSINPNSSFYVCTHL